MKKQFEEISSQLDKIVGGQNLFDIDTQANDTVICKDSCSEICNDGPGSITGFVKGTKYPEPEPLKPVIK